MIKGYKIKYLSPHTQIKSYTLFGSFCWGYRLLKGKSALESFLKDFLEEPKFLISSSFPMAESKLLFPKPIFTLTNEKSIPVIDKLKRKPYQKANYITQSVFEDVLKGITKTQNDFMKNYKVKYGIVHKLDEDVEGIKIKDLVFAHNEIDRINNNSKNLYFEAGILSDKEYFLVKFLDKSFINDFKIVLNVIEDTGLGGNKNTGWGKVKITLLEKDFSFLMKEKSNMFITLSPIIPTENILLNKSLYNFSTFKSFTEGSFSQGNVKDKVIYLEEGSLIKIKNNKGVAGTIKTFNIDEDFNNVFQYGLEFPIYLEWNND